MTWYSILLMAILFGGMNSQLSRSCEEFKLLSTSFISSIFLLNAKSSLIRFDPILNYVWLSVDPVLFRTFVSLVAWDTLKSSSSFPSDSIIVFLAEWNSFLESVLC